MVLGEEKVGGRELAGAFLQRGWRLALKSVAVCRKSRGRGRRGACAGGAKSKKGAEWAASAAALYNEMRAQV